MLEVKDVFRELFPKEAEFSHYYNKQGSNNAATRLDRMMCAHLVIQILLILAINIIFRRKSCQIQTIRNGFALAATVTSTPEKLEDSVK